ncbi:hypothetical protein BHC53_08380 [Snodgrassella alvi]|nr:hypothetical protein [Snodgrassella alvi]PIT40261.1 hypothetical protein BHC53_08380 [Snodgrassella alvi]
MDHVLANSHVVCRSLCVRMVVEIFCYLVGSIRWTELPDTYIIGDANHHRRKKITGAITGNTINGRNQQNSHDMHNDVAGLRVLFRS